MTSSARRHLQHPSRVATTTDRHNRLPWREDVITGVPTAEDFKNSGLGFLNLAWESALAHERDHTALRFDRDVNEQTLEEMPLTLEVRAHHPEASRAVKLSSAAETLSAKTGPTIGASSGQDLGQLPAAAEVGRLPATSPIRLDGWRLRAHCRGIGVAG